MAGFFDRFFKKTEAGGEKHLQFDEVPGCLDREAKDAGAKIESAAKDARSAAVAGIKEIEEKIRNLEKTEISELSHPHPKVRQTALKSRANFITSMNKTLATELPEDPDQLYNVLVELIRSFSNNMRRQGKYLHPTFPEEMKDLKSSLDIVGRALNTMTKELKPSVELREKINKAREDYEKISSAANELRTIDSDAVKYGERIESLNNNRADLESEKKSVLSSGDYLEYESILKEIDSLKEEKSEVSGRYGSLLLSCDNVLRKTAYIADKNGDKKISEKMNYLVMLLHSGEKKDSADASELYRELYPYINKTISENETIIKTKHEAQLFSSANLFISQLDEICTAYSGTMSEIDSADTRLSALGINEKISGIDKKASDIESELEKIRYELDAGQSRKESLEDSVPELIDDLKSLLSEIEGGDVFIEGDWKDLARET
ncbi:V-type ATP synthase subunit I domain-containing protein [Methanolacinia paynteri]|uniref:hypothetical protein n=1 Tax=Methanolacinia paynteri TaxID=230356 RepID=UPI00064FAE2F|nr:hypothetical protein [Methanolacinia paynteri]